MNNVQCYQMFDDFIDGIVVVDQNLSTIYINQTIANRSSFSLKRVIGQNPHLSKILKLTSKHTWPNDINELINMYKYQEVELLTSNNNKTTSLVKFGPTSIPEYLGDHWILYVHDTYLELSLQDKYKKQKNETENAITLLEANRDIIHQGQLEALYEMSKGMSHEVNNPLAIIKGKVTKIERLLDSSAHGPSSYTLHISKIIEMVERIHEITSNLKKFSSTDAEETRSATPIKDILDPSISLCKLQLEENGIKLSISSYDSSISINCNPAQISQAIFNLLMNSRDAVDTLNNKWINIDIKKNENSVLISITDSGSGIPVDIQEKVLWPFFTTKDVGSGKGLGLSCSSGIITQHLGNIELDKKCENTRFVITLPLT